MALAFEKVQVPSIYSKPHQNALSIRNYFPQGVGGTLSIVVPKDEYADRLEKDNVAAPTPDNLPDRWTVEPPEGTFKLGRDATIKFPFEIRLKTTSTYGRQPIRIDFRVEADEDYVFSVYRNMEVGTGDVTLDVNTHINEDGTLIVEQYMTNLREQAADFKCNLRATGRRTKQSQVYQLQGKIPDRKIYRFPKGRELLGQHLLLEIEEVNGDRNFRYRVEVTDQPQAVDEKTPAAKRPSPVDQARVAPGGRSE
jgi:hypothetical protein